MTGPIRLACGQCDRTDFDGVSAIPDDWQDVSELQLAARSQEEIHPDDANRSVMEWYTHIGTCPACAALEDGDGNVNEP